MNRKRIILLKGSTLLVFIFIVLSAVLFSEIYYHKSKDRTAAVFLNNIGVNKNPYKDFLMSSIDPYINEAIENYYGEHKEVAYKDILEINRVGKETDKIEIIARVTTKNDESKYSYGVDTITIIKSENNIEVKKYKHDDLATLKRFNRP